MQVREALIYALQNDTNPGVRLKSLDALGNYVKRRYAMFATRCCARLVNDDEFRSAH